MTTPVALTGGTLSFDCSGRDLIVIEPAAVTRVTLADATTMRIPIPQARAAIGLHEQLWIVTSDSALAQFDASGQPIATPLALPVGDRWIGAPGKTPAAAWGTTLIIEEHGVLTMQAHDRVDCVLPMGRRRCAVVRGHRVALPSGQLAILPPASQVEGGVVLADGKTCVLVVARGAARQLIVVSLATAALGFRCTLTGEIRIGVARGLAVLQTEPRVLRALDLRNGRDLGTIAIDGDIADYAVDPDGTRLAVRDRAGAVELVEIADVMDSATSVLVMPKREPASPPAVHVPATRSLPFTARGRYTHGRFALPDDPCAELTVTSPTMRETLGVWPCGAGDVDDAVDSARAAAPPWRTVTLDERLALITRIEAVLERRGGELASVLQRELGRPTWECRREVAGLVPRLRDLAALARTELADVACGNARIDRRAHGVAAVVSPVMLPIATAHAQLIAALIAGNTVVWKPSSLAAASAQLYIEILDAAGLPAGVINLVQGDAATGARLLAHAGIDLAAFTGSREHARDVRRATCERLELATLIHAGSKNAAIVLAGTDLAAAAEAIATCAYLSAGQRSTAIGRVLVESDQLDALVDALAAHARTLATTPQFAGPLASAERFDRYLARLAAAADAGARAIVRPEWRPNSLAVSPSIHVVDPGDAPAYLRDELFGPDLAVEPIDHLDDAFARLAGHPAQFVSVFAPEGVRVRCERSLEAGALLYDHAPTTVSGRLTFAAKGAAERGPRALLAMTRASAVIAAATGVALPAVGQRAAGAS